MSCFFQAKVNKADVGKYLSVLTGFARLRFQDCRAGASAEVFYKSGET